MVEASTRKWNGRRFVTAGHWKWLLASVVAVIALVGVGFSLGRSGSEPSTSGLHNDKLTQMEHSGTMQVMLQQHQNMMEQMRVSLSPQMQGIMDADPMWKSMRSGDFSQMMQDQRQQIDRMLGRGAP